MTEKTQMEKSEAPRGKLQDFLAKKDKNELKPAARLPRKTIVKIAAGIAVLVVVVIWNLGVFHARTPAGRAPYLSGLLLPENAGQFTVKAENIAPRMGLAGTVASDVMVKINARLASCVKEVFVSAGSPVKQGQDLITLDDRELKEQVAAAEARGKQAETEFNRTRRLFDNKASTEQALTSAQSMLGETRAHWERSKVMLTYATIVSPMDGVITDRRVEPGDLAVPGQVLMSIYDPSRMRLEVPVPVRLVGKLPLNQLVDITLERPATNLQGRVSQIVSEIDPLSRTQLIKIRIEETSLKIMPGDFGRVWVADEARCALMIPTSAVYRVGQVELVQIVKEGRAVRRAIRTGLRQGDLVEALSGINAGDVLLLKPLMED